MGVVEKERGDGISPCLSDSTPGIANGRPMCQHILFCCRVPMEGDNSWRCGRRDLKEKGSCPWWSGETKSPNLDSLHMTELAGVLGARQRDFDQKKRNIGDHKYKSKYLKC